MRTDEQDSEVEETIMLRGKMTRDVFAEIQRLAAKRRVTSAVMVGDLIRAGLTCLDGDEKR